jgi:nucleoid DNA-binding protein
VCILLIFIEFSALRISTMPGAGGAARGGAAKPKAMTKSQVVKELADQNGMTSKQAGEFLSSLASLVDKELRRAKQFTIPDIAKLTVKDTPAKPARPGRNPATGETIMLKPKPASRKVTAKPAGATKNMYKK